MREQTQRNIMYLAGVETLKKLARALGWTGQQFEAARAELERRFAPTLVET